MSTRQPTGADLRPPPAPDTEPVRLRLAASPAQPGSQDDSRGSAWGEGQADAVLEQIADAVVVMDPDGRIQRVNAAFSRLTGMPAASAAGLEMSRLLAGPEDERRLAAGLARLQRVDHWRGRVHLRRRDSGCFPARLTLSAVAGGGGPMTHAAAVFCDISDAVQAEERICRRAHYDAGTGLPGRVLFQERLAQAIREARRRETLVGLLFVDLDNFKTVNDQLGHTQGDRLLREIAGRLSGAARAQDTVARIGGDEFAVVLPDLHAPEDAATVADKLRGALASPLRRVDLDTACRASIGIALYPLDSTEPGALRKFADLAMYQSKAAGGGRHHFFTPALHARAQAQARAAMHLRRAMADDQFELRCQPIRRVESGALWGADLQVHWQPPDTATLNHAGVVARARALRQSDSLEDWVLGAARRAAARWPKAPGSAALTLTLDLTGGPRPDSRTALQAALEAAAAAPRGNRRMLRLDAGSQLTGIHRGGFVTLEPVLVDALAHDPEMAARLDAIAVLAHGLGLAVLAQGVATQAQWTRLRRLGCDLVQGPLAGGPCPADQFEAYLKEA